MAERPLYTLYKNLKAQNYDVPDDYNKFESALTRDGKGGADNRHAIYENLKAQNFDVPDTYERFYSALFEPRSRTSSRAKGGSVPMSAADRARFSAGAAAISASANNTVRQAKRNIQTKLGQAKKFDGGRVTPRLKNPLQNQNVQKNEFNYNSTTGKTGTYTTTDGVEFDNEYDAAQYQNKLDKYGEEWSNAVYMGIVPSELDKADPDLSDTDVAMRQMERRQEWLNENQDRRSKELNESMKLQGSPFVASGGAVAPSSFNTAISNEANRLSDVEYGAYNTAKAYNQMLRTTLLQELKEQRQRNENAGWWKDKWNDVSNYFGAFFNTMLDPKLYSQGVMDAAISNNLLQVKKGMEDGTIKKGSNAGNAAQAMLGAIQQQQGEASKQQQYGSKAYYYGDMSGRSLKFMADFASSGWRNVMTTGFTKAGEKVGEKMALGALGKWFTKNTGRVLGDIAGSAALAATNQLGSTYNNVIERYVGINNENGGVTQDKNGDLKFNEGVSLGKAIKDGFGSATIENFSEMFGEYLPGAPKLLSKLGLSKVSSFFEKIGNNAYYKWLSNATNKSGIQGVMAEISEEEFGTALHAAWGDGDGSWSDFNVFTNPDAREKQIDTCLGMFYSVGFMQAPRTAVGAINAVQYFNIKHQVAKADKFGQMMFNDKWEDIKSKIDVTTNADLTKTVLDATRSDSMTAKQKGAVINYAMFLSKLRGFNQASDAKTKDKVEEGDTAPTLSNDLDDAYTEGHNADDTDKHNIQLEQNDKANELAAMLNITPEQLHDMADEDLEAMTGQDEKLDQAIYDYQVSTAKFQGVMDGAQDEVDMAAHQAAMETDNMTDLSRGTVRKATIKATGGLEDYEVYIISGNIATHDDGSIDVGNSDDMIIYYDPTTGRKEHADAMMFADLIEELPAADVKAQAINDAKENAIKKIAGIIDGTVEVGSKFNVTDTDGTEHTYEVLFDYGDGTAAISIDGNGVVNPYSLADLQQMKDLEDQKRLEAAKAEREQMEKERAAQQNQEAEETQPSFDFNQILNDNGNVVLADVLGKDGNTKYPNSQLFLIRDSGAKAKVVELKSDGTLVPHAVNKKDVRTSTTMTLDEYKQAFAESSMIEDNSGENRGEIEVETPTIEGETVAPAEETTSPESAETAATEQTPAITLEDGTIVPMLEDGNPDFSKLTAAQTAELYDTQFGDDADSVISSWVSDAKKALDKASNMTVKGKTFVEQKASKDAKEKAIADAQAAYDSAVSIRDAYNERQLAKEQDTTEGRRNLIEKARRKFSRLKSAVKDDAEAVSQLYRDTVGSLMHRLYDSTGIDVTDTVPLTAEEYVASNLGAHSLNYEGTETSKGVKQETGLSREDFAKTQLLAADGKGTTIDALIHSLWENRPSNLESLDTQDIRNALIGVLSSGFKASEARNFVENIRIAQAENILEEQKRAQENADYAEQQKAEQEAELKAKSDEKAELKAKSEDKLDNESDNESNDLSNESDNEETNDKINDNINTLTPEQQKAKEDGEKLGFPAVDNEGEPINQYVIELANWAKEQGLKIDPTSKWNNYADLFIMCKDGFGVGTLVPDRGESINQVVYFPDNVQGFDQLWKLHEEFNVGRDLKHSADMDNEQTQGAMFYDGDTAREFKEFVDKKVEEQNKVFGEQRTEEDLLFSAKENGKKQTTAERAADVEKNKVDDMKVVDNIIGQKTRKTLEKLAKMMGANVQWQYSYKNANGWFDNKTNTIYLTLDSSITEGVQFIFGHEMTHQIKNLNPAAYNELTQLVLDTYGSDAFDKAIDETMKRYSDAGFSGRNRDYYAEEVVADAVGEMIRDLNLAHTLAMKMSHPLLAAIHEILQKIKLAFFGTEYSDVTKNIIRSIEQAYVKTANREAVDAATQEGEVGQRLSLRTKPEPKKTQKVYKLMRLGEDGKLYPLFIGSGEAIELGKWYDADSPKLQDLTSLSSKDYVGTRTAKKDGVSVKEEYHYGAYIVNNKTGEAMSLADFKAKYSKQFARMGNNPNKKAVDWATDNGYRWIKIEEKNQGQSRYGGEARSYYNYGINGSGSVSIFAMRPGWHAGSLPTMRQIGKGSAKNLRDDTFVWVEGEIPAEIDYNEEAQKNADKDIPDHIPTDGYYLKATNANKEASQADKVGWYVAGAFRANRIMSDKETRDIIDEWNATHPDDNVEYDWKRESGKDFNAKTMSLEDTPKFSLKVYHGSGADFTEFDFDHMGEGAGSQVFGWGGYVTSSKKIGKSYATLMDNDPSKAYYRIQRSNGTRFAKKYPTLESFLHGDKQIAMNDKFTEQEKIDFYNEMKKLAEPYHNLYEVDIPDDNGSNYLEWYGDVPSNLDKEKLAELILDKTGAKEKVARFKATPAYLKGLEFDIKKLINEAQTGQKLYTNISSFVSEKDASKILSALGYTGIKYPAGTIMGGAKKGDVNYVIFKPDDMRITEHTKFSLKDIKPVGKNKFGDVYDQFKGKPKEAFDFLLKNKDGYLKGVFHRDEIGDIDLGYGEAPTPYTGYGLAHIIRKHVELMNDFDSVDDAVNAIIDVISNGKVEPINKDRVYEINKDIYRVAIAKDENGNWVLSAMDKSRSKKQKLRDKSKKGAATVVPPSLPSDGAGAVAPNLSAAKIDNSSETAKENGEKFSLKDEKIKSVAEKFGVNEDDVAMYANAVERGSTAEAARARANIKRYLLQANEDKISSLKDIIKYTKPINEALKENFGDLDAMIEERRKQVEAERNAMEAARKRAQEEEEKRQKHLSELSLIPTDELDKRYMDAIANNDESTAREMLDEAARRKGYDDTESAYQGVGAWAAPGNPGYESDKARRDDWESSGSDVNLEDMALGYTPQPDDYFSHPERYSQNTPHGLESVKAINTAIDAIKNGEKDVKVKVYRAVPTSVKEGKLRNGDWVTPSKKYAEMHGDNRLEGKYRIIEDEVPANQLWWDGNDANEFGFDDGREYRYKNAKNNRKLNDLITYDNNGNVIPPSKRFNSRKNDIRFSLKAEKEKIVTDAKANGTYMTAPNGEKTKLDAEQWATVRTTNFKNWFGDWENDPENASKVVDENGEPMVVWHGRSAEFNIFEKKEGVRFIMGLEDKVKAEGFFFSPDKGLAEEFASNSSRHRGGKANVVPCFLNIRRPMDLTGEDYDRIYEDVTGWEYMVGMDTQDNLWGIMDEEGMADKIKEKGYDGAIFVEEVDDSYEPTKISYCALDSNQIKSAENNNGDFSADNNDIRFSLKSMMAKPDGWKQANKKAIHIAEAIERDPKFSLKNLDGTLIKAGTYFSGGGLVEEGLKGIIDPVVAVEYDEKISGVYRNNFGKHIVTADVRDVDPRELVKNIDGEVEYFHASPVCKNYSQAKSNHAEVELDKETAASTAEFINAVKPKVVTIENVKGYKDSEAMKIITDALDANGYTWDADVYNAADYGGYTNRERLIVRAVRDGKLPEKPKKMAHKSGWYEAVADIIPTLTEKKNGVAPWMDIRLKADGIDWRNIDKPLYVMGSAYADGKVPHAFADELLPTLRTKSGDVIVMPDGKVYRAMGRVLARVSGVSDDYKMPFSENLSHTIIGNGIPTQLTEHVIAPLLTGSDPKFSIRTYHGTGASFDKFDLSHALEGEGSETFGHGVYVTNSSKIGREYAQRAKQRKMADLYKNMRYPDGVKGDIFKRRVFGEMVNDVATGGSVASAKEFAKKRVGADANDIQRTLENLKDREKGTEYEQNLNDRLAEYKEALKWIDSIDEDYLTQGNANRYDVDIPDDNGSNYLDWEGTIPASLDKQKVAEDAYKVVSDNQGFNDFKATPLNDFIAHTLKTYVNITDVAVSVEKLKSDIKDVIEDDLADDDVLALNEYLKDATTDDVLATIWYNDLVRDIDNSETGEELYRKLSTYVGDNAASEILADNGFVGIKYPAGLIHGGAEEGDYNYVIFDENNANIVGNTRFSLRYDKFEHDLNQWKKDNNLPKDAQRPTIPQRNAGESAVDFLRRVDEYRKQMALWKTAPTYEQHLLSDDTALGEFNRELQRGSVLKRIAFQDSMLAIRKAQEAIMKEVGVDRLNMAEDAYTAENRSHGKGKNEFEEYNNEFLQPLRKAYHQMKKVLGDSYDNVRVYMMAKHGLERDAQMAFKKSLEADYEDVNQRSAAYKAYKNDLDRVSNDADLEFGRVDFTTWRQKDNALRGKYSPSYMDYRYDDNGIAYDYSGLSSLFDGSDFEEAAHRLVRNVETKHLAEVQALWNATNAATKKILRDGFKAGMMSKDAYEYVKGMYSHYIPLRGWDGTTADQVWDYIGGGKGAFNQTLKTAHGRTSIADDPIAYIENMAESGILLNNKNWVKQHLMLLAQNHPTSLLTLSKAWYVKSTDANGNEEWIPATPQITSQMNSNHVKAAIDAFEQKMEQMAQTGDATQQRDGLNIAYPQTHSEEREHEVRVMKDGEEYVIYVNGDPQLAQAMNNTRAHRVREIQSGKLDRAAAWLGRKMAAAYTSLSPLFIPSNYFRDLTMTLASTAIREDGRYNYLLRKNLATSWNLGFMLRDYQNGKLREKVNNGNATAKEQMFYDFMMNGGETGFVSSLDVEDLKKKFKNDLKDLDRWKANPVKVGHTIMDSIEFLNRAIEDSNRFAVYMTSIQYGRSIDEAVNDAKDVTLNFNRKGTGEYGWQMIRNLYLFINPAVQSLQTLGALAKHHTFKFTAVTAAWLASGVLVPIVNAALMSLLGGDDDKDKYWQFSKWDRRNNLIMWVPFTNEYVKIPLAQEFRAFYGIGDMIASKMMGGELSEETWSQYSEDLLGQVVDMLPLDPTGYDGNIAVSLMPNPIRPVFELAFNVDFTGKPLFKETEYNKYDPNFTKAYVGTPDWLVRVSKMVNSIGNDYPDVQQNAIDAFGDPRYNLNNPAVVDHVLSSYLGGAYTMGSQVLGFLTKSLNDPKEIKMADIPLVSKFVSNPDDRPVTKKQGDEFWNMKENYDRAANTLSKLKKQAKVDGDYSMLERFYGSEEYKQHKQDDVKVKKYEEDKKKERAEESGEEYRPHKLNAEDIYKAHATPKDDFEDLKLKQLYTKLNGFKSAYDLLVDTAPSQSDGYYNTNKAAIDAIDEISLDKQEISELKKGFLDDGKDAYNAEDMKQIRELRKKILAVLERANKVVVANQKAKAEK